MHTHSWQSSCLGKTTALNKKKYCYLWCSQGSNLGPLQFPTFINDFWSPMRILSWLRTLAIKYIEAIISSHCAISSTYLTKASIHSGLRWSFEKYFFRFCTQEDIIGYDCIILWNTLYAYHTFSLDKKVTRHDIV